MTSLRRTLLVTLLAAIAALILTAAFLVYRLARHEIDNIFDYHLRQIALTLRDQVPGQTGTGGPGGYDFAIQMWNSEGVRLFVSRPEAGLPDFAELGFSTVNTGGEGWRVYSAALSGVIVQVAQPLRVRQRLAFEAASRTLAPVLAILPLLIFLVWRIVGRSLAPLERLALAVASRTPAALTPIAETGVPDEALPLVRSTNELLGRLATALNAQRAFLADAAHELRTPLAALSLQLELLERAKSDTERAPAMSDLKAGLRRAGHLVEQLLALARAEPDAAVTTKEPVDLSELVTQIVTDHALLAEAKGVDLGVTSGPGPVVVRGELTSLRTLLANLVDNAVRYTKSGGRVDVAAGVSDARPFLSVADSGPGIPEDERERVFDRFYRRKGLVEEGSGLGLAIVKAIANRHQASLGLSDTPGGGLTVQVEFPPLAG